MPPVDQCGHVDPRFQPTAPVIAESWQYDPLGRISQSSALGIISYHPSSIYEITAASSLPGTFAYDPKGNQTERPGRTIQYSPFDLPTEITTGSAVTLLQYDGLLQRASRDVVDSGQAVSSSIYAGPRFEIETRDESGIQVTRARYNIYAKKRFIGQKTVRSQAGSYVDEGFQFVHSDQLGNLHMMTDGAGTMTTIHMSAFGTPLGMNGPDHSMPIGSGDHRWDDTNGLREMGGRAFDALTSSFVSPDPLPGRLGRAADWNPYALAGQRPLLDADPSGLQVPTFTIEMKIEVGPEPATPLPRPHISFLSNAPHPPIGVWVGGGYVSPSSGIGASLESGLASIDTALASGASGFGEFVHDATGSWILGGLANTLSDVLVTVPRGILNIHHLPSAIADIPRQVGEGAAMIVEGIETGNGYTFGKGAGQLLGGVGAVAGIVAGVGSVVRGGATSAATRGAGRAGEAGRFADLDARAVTGDALTPHHIPQVALKFTSRADGGAIVMTAEEHALTRTFGGRGIGTARSDAGLSFRRVVSQDIRDVRGIVGRRYNEGLRALLKYYRENFPELLEK
jgi:RHS repeat-associated protein